MKKVVFAFVLLIFASCNSPRPNPVPQISLQRVNEMPDLPEPFQIIDFKKLALQFDSTIYDFNAKGEYWPLVWVDSSKKNFPQNVVGL